MKHYLFKIALMNCTLNDPTALLVSDSYLCAIKFRNHCRINSNFGLLPFSYDKDD